MNLNFNVGDKISIGEITYTVDGKITYIDGDYIWDEYVIFNSGQESWLSIDNEESVFIWQMTPRIDTSGMEQTDSGTECVNFCYGNVDVEPGDTARYTEYHNPQDDTYVSIEIWDDETEYSTGRRIAAESIMLVSSNPTPPPHRERESGVSIFFKKIGCFGIIIVAMFVFVGIFSDSDFSVTIKEKIENNPDFPWETSITGYDNKNADVYYTDFDAEEAATNIIDLIEGELDYVQENPQDTLTIAILTKREVCMIYRDTSDNSTLVHLATRQWTLDNLEAPLYHGDSATNNFYRGFYQYYAFATDTTDYSSDGNGYYRYYHHHYGTYFGSAYLLSHSRYSSYSSSVREASAARRRSSGGGHGGGGK